MSCTPSPATVRSALLEVGAVVLAAGLVVAAFPPVGATLTVWIALLPVLWVLGRAPVGRAALLGALYGTLYAALATQWLLPTFRDYFGRSPLFTIGFLVPFWIATGGVYHAALFGGLALWRERVSRGIWLALIPAAWVAIEFVRTHLGIRSPWTTLGDGVFPYASLRQAASVTGIYGLSAIVVAVNIALHELGLALRSPRDRHTRRRAWVSAGVAAALLLAAGAHGVARRASLRAALEATDAEGVEVVVVQGNVGSELRWKRSQALRVLARYGQLTLAALREGPADLVVWPEQALQTSPDDPAVAPSLALLRARARTPLLIGAVRHDPSGTFNAAFLLRDGAPRLHYDKQRLLAFSETQPLGDWLSFAEDGDLAPSRYSAGTSAGLLGGFDTPLGVTICFEGVYPPLTRSLARGGARVLVNLANDSWFRGRGGHGQHLRQVVFRAVETGLPLVRAASDGISTVVEPDGRIVERLAAGERGILRATVRLPAGAAATLYTRLGDWFAWLCIAAVMLATGWCLALRVADLPTPHGDAHSRA